ncbi:MAG: histidine--tRNA ligase [Gammaproteobacteria bacterium]|nr:histidine--tRNA ligase [Gammaproteobacteria bacterium]MDE0650945.1 histidine--tRNA ligase [Gammaproteobacteria bacterium]MXW10952.1 histidine--tRNA ligase [Gammaproteobacteria bacterium]MYC52237.1 histidine--tRNA ligase [Gammaproteobacteria bacterium]
MQKGKTFPRLPGFRDFAPEALAEREHVFRSWRGMARRYGFQEYDGPPLEPLELYREKSGDEIVGQLYAFVDKGGREVSLRPEMTPSLARMLGERSRAMPKPIRWFSIPQLFRYERQQRGRLREHFQWNVDILGEAGTGADAEVLAVAVDALRALGLGPDDFLARVSDRRLLSAILDALGVPGDRIAATYVHIDKYERVGPDLTRARLHESVGLAPRAVDSLLEILDGSGLDVVEDLLGERDAVGASLAELHRYQADLTAMGLGPFLRFDLRIVRGLAYYTGIVFELFDRRGEMRAICGGGRYDQLLERVGGEPLAAVGFGMGDVVLTELLRDRGLLPRTTPAVDWFIASVSPAQRLLGREIAHALREAGSTVSYALEQRPVRKQLAMAARQGARRVILLGPEETARGVALIRDMAQGSQQEVSLADLRRGRPTP